MNNKGLLAIAASACLAMLPQGAFAAKGFNYTYVDGGYQGIRADSADADGFAADLSYGATDHIIVLAGYSHLWQDEAEGFSSVDVDVDRFTIGGGGHYSITERIDLVGSLVYVNEQSSGKAKYPFETSKSRVKGTREGYEAVFSGRIRAMVLTQLRRRLGQYFRTSRANGHLGTFARQTRGDALTDSFTAAGDHRNLVSESQVHGCLPLGR